MKRYKKLCLIQRVVWIRHSFYLDMVRKFRILLARRLPNLNHRLDTGYKMKKLLFAAFLICVCVENSYATLSICMSLSDCQNSPMCSAYCCPTGQTKTTYTCPTGWTVSGTKCIRTNQTGLTDSTGTYDIIYDDCDAQATTTPCFRFGTSPQISNGDGTYTRCTACL